MRGNRALGESAVAVGAAGAPYEPGLLALREGPLLEAALRLLAEPSPRDRSQPLSGRRTDTRTQRRR
jgi:hypothetical protein